MQLRFQIQFLFPNSITGITGSARSLDVSQHASSVVFSPSESRWRSCTISTPPTTGYCAGPRAIFACETARQFFGMGWSSLANVRFGSVSSLNSHVHLLTVRARRKEFALCASRIIFRQSVFSNSHLGELDRAFLSSITRMLRDLWNLASKPVVLR
jgi:hypothetical protein